MSNTTFQSPYLKALHHQKNVYDRFVPDQVLTHHNLNKIIDYFEDQDRLSRVHTIGVGIGGGLDFFVDLDDEGNTSIKVNSGVGITTDGDLVVVDSSKTTSEHTAYEFRYITSFIDNSNYERFSGLKIYEIHTQEGAELLKEEQPLSSFSNLSDYHLLVYVENYSEKPGICSDDGCDDNGEKVYSNLKFLLTDKEGFETLTLEENDSIFHYKSMRSFYDTLPELFITKPILKVSNTKEKDSLYTLFKNEIEADNLAQKLEDSYLKIIKKLDNRLNVKRFDIRPENVKQAFEKLFEIPSFPVLDIQYKYDLLKDLVETYTEIKSLLLHINADCVPNTKAFPKHLLLGALDASKREFTRHEFYPSPLVDSDDEHLMQVLSLIIRFYNQLTHYEIPSKASIKITPSRDYSYQLSDRSIPYYYKTSGNLLNYWNHNDIINRRKTAQLGYHHGKLLNTGAVQNPLKYNYLGHDFYRIEGHLGQPFKEVLSKINHVKKEYNLAFDVKAVSLKNAFNVIEIEDYHCHFDDLITVIKAWKTEFECLTDNGYDFFSKYSFKEVGDNKTKTIYLEYQAEINEKQRKARRTKARSKSKTKAKASKYEILELLRGKVSDKDKTNPTKKTDKKDRNIYDRNIYNIKNIDTEIFDSNQLIDIIRNNPGLIYSDFLKDKNTIDSAINYAVSVAKNNDPDTIYKIAKEQIVGEVGRFEDEASALIYIDYPLKIAIDLYAVEMEFKDDIEFYTKANGLDTFEKYLSKLCFDINKAKEELVEARKKEIFGQKEKDSMYEFMVYEISKLCCYQSKIDWIQNEIENRKKDILKQLTLSEIVRNNSGLEHMAGVPKGGTFVVVYEGRDQKNYSNKVIADFAFPYMFSSHCPPDVIVINQSSSDDDPEITDVKLSQEVYCFKEGGTLKNGVFEPVSEDVKITSEQGEDFIIDNAEFDPNKVSTDLFGVPISFKANGKPIEQTATVYKIPSVNHFTENNLDIKVTAASPSKAKLSITPKTPYDANAYLTYKWSKGSKTLSDAKTLIVDVLVSRGKISQTFNLQLGINNPSAECEGTYKIEVNQEVDIQDEKTCYNEYIERLAKYKLDKHLNEAYAEIEDVRLKRTISSQIIKPTLELLETAKLLNENQFNDKNKIAAQLNEINKVLGILTKNYIADTKNSFFYEQLIKIHESLVILFLELTRCETKMELYEKELKVFKEYVMISRKIFARYKTKYVLINSAYFKAYDAKSNEMKKIKTLFSIR